MKLDRWKFYTHQLLTRSCVPHLHTHTHTGQHRFLFSLLDFIPLCPYYWMEMISILGKFLLAFAFAFFFTVLYYDPRIMANPGLAFCGWETCLLDSLASFSDANQWPILFDYKKVTFGRQTEYHVVIGSVVFESGYFL